MKDDVDLWVEQALWDPRNERADGLRAGAKATCGTCDQELSLVGVGRVGATVLEWDWRHMVNGNPEREGQSDHTPVPLDAHNFTDRKV